ncbi:hypothetical protein [Mangrovibacterium lignilyticum]|uniref:hypothetical protein n=1 Tax=Mangrovibacterium lignilyticum TaxID=2668052 RepID=UPI0013D652A3|nr:hypothetical protein [Mangrovibacterium lignilyticum]
MKKTALIALPLLLALCSLAQPAKKDFMLSFDANYYKNESTTMGSYSELDTEEKSLGLSFSVERFLSDRFAVGLGLARYWDKAEETNYELQGTLASLTHLELESNYWMPKIFCKYYLPLTKRLYAVPHLSGSFGQAKIAGAGATSTRDKLPTDELVLVDGSNTTTTSYGTQLDVKLLHVELAPEVVYFFAKHWGASAYLGGLRYDRSSGDLVDSEWTCSFKPKYWRLGVNFSF